MYLVYLRHVNGAIVGSVEHLASREEAERSFGRLVNETAYDGFDLIAVLVEDKQPVAIHRFSQQARRGGTRWRDRPSEIPFSSLH